VESYARAIRGIEERKLAAVFKKSGVTKSHAHRFRHTLATELLGAGASFEEVADCWGIARRSSGSTTRSGQLRDRRESTISWIRLGHKMGTRTKKACKLLQEQGEMWCGEGDLFSGSPLRTRKLYTSRRSKITKSSRSTRISHTGSHTA
jgi:hypothetical protein